MVSCCLGHPDGWVTVKIVPDLGLIKGTLSLVSIVLIILQKQVALIELSSP